MRSGRGTRLAVAGLAGAAGLLAFLDYHLLQSPIDISPVAPPVQKADLPHPGSPKPTTVLDRKKPEDFQATVSRPLFSPNRRPVQRGETAGGQPKAETAKLRLIGVIRPEDGPPRALIRFGDELTGRWIEEGGVYNGWTLTRVDENSVIVEAGGRTQELKLFLPRPPPKEPVGPAPKEPSGSEPEGAQ
jgi:hypothetical protein